MAEDEVQEGPEHNQPGWPLPHRGRATNLHRSTALTQFPHPTGIKQRQLPKNLLPDVPVGLNDFGHLTVRDASGKLQASVPMFFCPNSPDPDRLSPSAPATSPYPVECANDPFPLGQVWGVQKDWAIDPLQSAIPLQLPTGTYRVTETVAPAYIRLFHLTAADATASVNVTVVNGSPASPHQAAPRRPAPSISTTSPPPPWAPPRGPGAYSETLPALPQAQDLKEPPKNALPDLIPLPAFQIGTSTEASKDLLSFAAAVWVGGNSPLDIEGFRQHASPTMDAYQYFWRNGHVIGRARAGTMGFDSDSGHDHWHFKKFAEYRLLDSNKKLILRSNKVGFCISPTDPVNLLLPHATWQPPAIGFTGQCGSPTALWVRETMPVGWGDTYLQHVAGQAFDITNLPNGIYYVETTANPQKVLHETTTTNDSSLRKVILSGTAGQRTVKVPAWNGIDPEG
ncbi:lysyl oxidase family protein [Actinoallomurus sp. NPDC050550]|uniref:lysyl oxidase family protein n=1 Tax=Actinoallomurus sp. NPDC050550 TaxID=3154937 RepID=UPI0033F4D91E